MNHHKSSNFRIPQPVAATVAPTVVTNPLWGVHSLQLRKAAPSAPLRRLELLSHGSETHSCGAPSSCCSQQPSGWANIESPSGDFFRWKSRLFMHFTIQEKWHIAISFHQKATIEGKIRNTSPPLLHQMPLWLWLVLSWRCSSSSHWIHNHRCSGCIPTHGDVVSWFYPQQTPQCSSFLLFNMVIVDVTW